MTAGPRIGIFGGSFDPVHVAHLALARAALAELQLDELRWIPVGQAWQKSRPLSDAAHRLAMLRLAIEGEVHFVLDTLETDHPGPSYTLETVRTLAAARPDADWFLVIGHDQYAGLHTWNGWRELLARVTLAVANRPGEAAVPHDEVRRHAHRVVPLPMLDISATEVRRRVAAGADISMLVPPGVARYIDRHRLYRASPGS